MNLYSSKRVHIYIKVWKFDMECSPTRISTFKYFMELHHQHKNLKAIMLEYCDIGNASNFTVDNMEIGFYFVELLAVANILI